MVMAIRGFMPVPNSAASAAPAYGMVQPGGMAS